MSKTTQLYNLYKNLSETKNGLSVHDIASQLTIVPRSVPVYVWALKKRGVTVNTVKSPKTKGKLYSCPNDASSIEAAKIFENRKNSKKVA